MYLYANHVDLVYKIVATAGIIRSLTFIMPHNAAERDLKMADKKEIFADGIGQIHFAGGMVRFDFVTLQPEEDGKAPVPASNVRIIMPPQGFLGALNSMQQLIDKLVEAGVLQKNEQAAPAKGKK